MPEAEAPLTLTFRCPKRLEGVAPPPIPALQGLPDWLRSMPAQAFSGLSAGEDDTVKRCPPFIDAMTSGFLMPLISDLRVENGEGHGWVIDTPGVRSFGLGHVDTASILKSFTDLAEIAEDCPRGCTHLPDAPDCAIVEAVEAGRLGETGRARLDSLQRLLATFAG